jgi:2-dehydropantoate 2-reductase
MRVLIAGTGGVGGYFGARLQQAGNEVWFLARGDNLDALRTKGLRLESGFGDADLPRVNAVPDTAPVPEPVDAVLFCVKAYDNDATAGAIAPVVGPGTSIASLQNGVENEAFLAARFPEAIVLGGVARVEAWKEAPGVFRQRGPNNKLVVGAFRPQDRPAVGALGAAFAGTPVVFEHADDIESQLWYKLMSICCVGGITSYCRCPIGDARTDPDLRPLMASIAREVEAVAAARGIALPVKDPVPTVLGYIDEVLEPKLKASMCRDVEAGRPLEVEWLNGAVVRLGEALGIPTPANRTILDALLPFHKAALARRAEAAQAAGPSSTR